MTRRNVIVAPRRPGSSLAIAPTPEQLAREEAFVRAAPEVSEGHPSGVSQTPGRHPKPRAAAGSAVLFERKRGPAKRRMNVYFTPETFALLEEHCAREDVDLSRVIDVAVREHLARKARR
jgi:hypothetical protein